MLLGRNSSLINVGFFFFCSCRFFFAVEARDLRPAPPQPSAASRHFNSPSAGISCFDEAVGGAVVPRMNHPEVLERPQQLKSALIPVPPPPVRGLSFSFSISVSSPNKWKSRVT